MDSNVRDVAEYSLVDAEAVMEGIRCRRANSPYRAVIDSRVNNPLKNWRAGFDSLPSRSLNVIAQACLGLNNAVVSNRNNQHALTLEVKAAA